MSISRWDPWGDIVNLRDAMNQLFEEGFSKPRNGVAGSALSLAVDVEETPDAYRIHASVPGVQREAVDISLLGSTVTIRGLNMKICSQHIQLKTFQARQKTASQRNRIQSVDGKMKTK